MEELNMDKEPSNEVYYLKGDAMKRRMLDRLEVISDELEGQQTQLRSMGKMVLDKVEIAIKEDQITPYKMAIAYSKCTESLSRIAKMQMDLWDRLNGTVGALGQPLEEIVDDVVEDDVDIKIQREAEALVLELVRDEILGRRQA